MSTDFSDLRMSDTQGPFAHLWNRLLARLNSQRLTVCAPLRLSNTLSGQALSLTLSGLNKGATGLTPWQVYVAGGTGASAFRTVTVNAGTLCDGLTTEHPNNDSVGTAEKFIIPASKTLYAVYWHAQIDSGYHFTGSPKLTIATAASTPANSNVFDPTDIYGLIAEVTTSADVNATCTITQNIFSNQQFKICGKGNVETWSIG